MLISFIIDSYHREHLNERKKYTKRVRTGQLLKIDCRGGISPIKKKEQMKHQSILINLLKRGKLKHNLIDGKQKHNREKLRLGSMKFCTPTPQPTSRTVLIAPDFKGTTHLIKSTYPLAPIGNEVPPPGKKKRSPSNFIQFWVFLERMSLGKGTFLNQA